MTRPSRALVIDLCLALAVLAVSAAIAIRFVHAEPRPSYFFDWELVPSTVMACGKGFMQPGEPLPALVGFVGGQARAFDCSTLATGAPLIAAGSLARANRYGLYGPALFMALGGPTWRSLDLYLGCVFGLAMALTYALLRLVAMRGLAVVGTLVLACSNKLFPLLSHRDYIKEPPFLALLVVIGWIVMRQRPRREIWIASAIGGLVLGIGIGCRVDLLVIAPFFVVALLAFAQFAPAQSSWRNRGLGVGLFVAGFCLTGLPILTTLSGGSNTSHTVLLGFTSKSFTRNLGLAAPVYDVGDIYSDGYAFTLIAAQVHARENDRSDVPFGMQPYDRAGARLTSDIIRTFPADMLARGYGAVIEALNYPFKPEAVGDSRTIPGITTLPLLPSFVAARVWVLERLDGAGVWFTLLALVIVASFNIRLAACCAGAVIYFCAYSMLQFSRRHTFHLDVFSILAATFVLQALITGAWRLVTSGRDGTIGDQLKPAARNIAWFMVGSLIVLVGPLAAVRWWQDGHVATIIDDTLTATHLPNALTRTPINAGEVLIASDQLGHTGQPPLVDPRDVRMDYVVAEFRGPSCGNTPFEVRSQYTGVVRTLDKEFNRTQIVVPAVDGAASKVLGPVFYEYGPYWLKFDGFIVPTDRVECLTTMLRAEHPGQLPFPFLFASLSPDWRESGLYERFRWEQPWR